MNVKIEDIEKNVIQLEIEVDEATFKEALQKSYLKNIKKFNIPGFRKGKAPKAIIERYYGEDIFFEDAINTVCPEAYDNAIEENNIYAVDQPEIDIKQIGSGKSLIFTAKVVVKPEVELGEYKGIEVEKTDIIVTEDDVEKELNSIVEKNARMITIEDRSIIDGDIAVIDFEGFIDGVAFEGGKGSDHSLTIGSGQFIPGFEEQLIGAKVGDEIDVNVSFPEEYGSPDLAGKSALFKVNIKELKIKELPVVDDEFAKDVSEFDTLDEYKKELRKNLTESAKHKAKHDTEDKIVNKVIENATVDIPKIMIEKRIDNLVYDFSMRLHYQGLELKKYLEIMGIDENAFRNEFSERAENEVKAQLVLEKINEIEKFEISEEEINKEIEKLATNYKQDLEDFMKHLGPNDIDYIKNDLITKKTVDFLVGNTKLI